MITITTRNDLRNWVDQATANWDCRTGDDVDAITNAIQGSDHPRWGSDWREFLDSLPDDLSELL